MLRRAQPTVCSRPRALRRRLGAESGFTLIELLVVILIIGVLAAIALPQFLDQRHKGFDARAKSNARNTVSQVESCFTRTESYEDCTTAAGSELDGALPDTVVTSNGPGEYLIVATSQTTNTFSIERSASGEIDRTCTNTGTTEGGCRAALWW